MHFIQPKALHQPALYLIVFLTSFNSYLCIVMCEWEQFFFYERQENNVACEHATTIKAFCSILLKRSSNTDIVFLQGSLAA